MAMGWGVGVTDGISDGIITMCPKSCLSPPSNPDRKRKQRKVQLCSELSFLLNLSSLFPATIPLYLLPPHLHSWFSQTVLLNIGAFTNWCTQCSMFFPPHLFWWWFFFIFAFFVSFYCSFSFLMEHFAISSHLLRMSKGQYFTPTSVSFCYLFYIFHLFLKL